MVTQKSFAIVFLRFNPFVQITRVYFLLLYFGCNHNTFLDAGFDINNTYYFKKEKLFLFFFFNQ